MGIGLLNTGAGFGGGGVQITQQVASQLSSLLAIAITNTNAATAFQPGQATQGPYRPIGWAKSDPTGQKARYSLSYQLPQQASSSTNAALTVNNSQASNVSLAPLTSNQVQTSYAVFDAVISASFNTRLKITDYPVQTGQNFSYNAVLEPARITMQVGVYDTVAAYDVSMWTGASSKSYAALKLMQLLQQQRVPITINSRWGSYYPMLLEDVTLPDNYETFAAAKMTLVFRQVFVASLAPVGQSSRNQTTDTTNVGNTTSSPVPSNVTTNNMLTTAQTNQVSSLQVVTNNSGQVSSNPVSGLTIQPPSVSNLTTGLPGGS